MISTEAIGVGYILTADGYARTLRNGRCLRGVQFAGAPVFEEVLRLQQSSGGDASLNDERIVSLVTRFIEWIRHDYELHTFRVNNPLHVKSDFGGLRFEDFLRSPELGKLPVNEKTRDSAIRFILGQQQSRAQRNLFLVLLFGEPVTIV